MKTFWKVLLGLALVVPMVAYVAGSLVASAADDPAPRETIRIEEPKPSAKPSATVRTPPSSDPDDDDVEVIVPDFEDLDDHDDRGDDDGEDHSGPGGGDDDHEDDDHSGHGGGDDDSGHGGED